MRGAPSGPAPSGTFPAWSTWTSCGGTFASDSGGLAVTIPNYGCGELRCPDVTRIYGIGLDHAVWENALTSNASNGSQSGWHHVPGTPTDATGPVDATSTSATHRCATVIVPSGKWPAWFHRVLELA